MNPQWPTSNIFLASKEIYMYIYNLILTNDNLLSCEQLKQKQK